jgi:branched-chain amino acid transport system ATP-binding protein
MLKILNLEAGYGELRVLKGISLHVAPGEVVTVIGANGAGKTTLLKTIAGILKARCGEVEFDKRRIHNEPAERIVARGCCLVPEGRHIFSTLTVQENLILGSYCRARAARPWKRALHRTDNGQSIEATLGQVYELFGILQERSSQLAGTLSGGQQQMLSAGALSPGRYDADEPSLGVARWS